MSMSLLAAAVVFACAPARAAAARPGMPLALPGFSEPARAVAARPGEGFPSATGLFGDAGDPLASLAKDDEDLRDSVASPITPDRLQEALRSADAETRLSAVRAAARPRAVSVIAPLAGALLRLDQPAQVRAAAALALGRIGDRVAVPSLAEALRDPVPDVRYAAALSLGRLPADGVATRLERVLRADTDWRARYAAAIALGRARKSFASDSLSTALYDDPSWQVRQQAARSLQDLGNPRAAPALAAALKDADPSVRAAAGDALADLGSADERRAVSDALRAERDPSVRTLLAASLRRTASKP